MSDEVWACKKCGFKSVIPVAMADGHRFYSCTNENCTWYAELLVKLSAGIFVEHKEFVNTFNKVWTEHEQDRFQESKD